MAQATETFALGGTQVTTVVEIDLSTVWLISGDFAGTIPSGQIGFINGDVNLTGDLIIEGLLTGIDTFTLTGNGFQLLFQNGGSVQLAGVEKSAWINWGDTPTNWQTGDRVAVAPTAQGVYVSSEILWGAARPVNSPDFLQADGSIARPEVVNLTQTIVLKTLRRIHFHDGAGVSSMKWLRVLNCGTPGVLADYPIHFHLNGEASRGSLLEEVVVEGGKNHAYVPHGSHGITLKGCVAYKTAGTAFWWDNPPPANTADEVNDSADIIYDHCLAMWVFWSSSDPSQYAGFSINAGRRDTCVDCVAVGVDGTGKSQRSGFLWGENRSRQAWDFRRCLAHNCKDSGIFGWQNTSGRHTIFEFKAYNCLNVGIDHGAYGNNYIYRDVVLTNAGITCHAKSLDSTLPNKELVFENILSDRPFDVRKHGTPQMRPSYVRHSTFPQIFYTEVDHPSYWRYEDCGLTPAKFVLSGAVIGMENIPAKIHANSIIEIYEAGILTHRWAAGSWT